jgi:hypothetical protein
MRNKYKINGMNERENSQFKVKSKYYICQNAKDDTLSFERATLLVR